MSVSIGTLQAQSSPTNRRAGPRYKLDWEIRVLPKGPSAQPEQPATLRNLSSSGALASLTSSPRLGDRMFVLIKLPLQTAIWMSFSATVVRVNQEGTGACVALRFDTSRPEFCGMNTVEQVRQTGSRQTLYCTHNNDQLTRVS